MAAEQSNSLLILISAPSGGGKTTLCEQLLATDPNIVRVITCTTRPPREGEQDGVDYYFLDVETFRRRVGAGDFLEHANVHGNLYGTLKSEVLSKLDLGKNVLLSVDVQGAAAIRERAETDLRLKQALVTVFITPPSMKTLEERLKTRGKDSPDVIDRRLGVAREEIAQWKFYDYLIPSTTIREDLRRMEAILIAEKMRQSRATSPLFD
ncbi:MAG: guanylate kinase [Pedosphaera sp.]|nr:guanylate kinase [Pedosphaera sp.]